MSTLEDRRSTALLVIDPQEGVVEGAHQRDEVLANIAALVDRARREDVPVIWVQHNDAQLERGSPPWRIVAELSPTADEPVVHKSYGDSFEDTPLESLLAGLGVGRLVVTGAQSDACVRCTLHGAFTRGYDVFLVADAHTTQDLTEWGAPPPGQVVAHTNLYWSYQAAPGRSAGVVSAAAVDFAGTG